MEQVFYNCHLKVSNFVLVNTSDRLRSLVEHAVLGLAVCAFVLVTLCHRTFVHRDDVASLARQLNDAGGTCTGNVDDGGYGLLGLFGQQHGVSMYSFIVQLASTIYITAADHVLVDERTHGGGGHPLGLRQHKIPSLCLRSVPGFREDVDVSHITLHTAEDSEKAKTRAFTIYKGHSHQIVVDGEISNATRTCVLGSIKGDRQASGRDKSFGLARDHQQECPDDISSYLLNHGYLPPYQAIEKAPPIIYSYTHSQGLLRLSPALQHSHNVTTQFIQVSTIDPYCFGDSFIRAIILNLVGADTVVLNWILGLQHAKPKPRYVYHRKTKRDLDLDIFDRDHYAFSGKSNDVERSYVLSNIPLLSFSSSGKLAATMRNAHRFLSFLGFKLLVLLSTLLIFFLTTSLVSFTFQETQDRMLDFTFKLQNRVRLRQPLGGLIAGHVLENLVFVPIMVGTVFFLIEFYNDDKFLAFAILSMVWICEVFSAISIRSTQGIHFFPQVFFLYFTLFHVYFFSCPVGFIYLSLASTVLFLVHTMLFFLNRYELRALQAGFITPHSPRMVGANRSEARVNTEDMLRSPPQIHHDLSNINGTGLPQIPNVSDADADEQSTQTSMTAPLSFSITAQPGQYTLLPPMRGYVAAASTSLQSIRSLASIPSVASLAERNTSPNLIFYNGFNDDSDTMVDDDSYLARVRSTN